jgi:hypothetical protein
LRDNYLKILDGKATPGEKKAFQDKAGEEVKAQQSLAEIGKMIRNPEARKAFEKMGIGQMIAAIAQVWKLFQEAMKTGDYTSLEDGLKDLQKGGDPMKRIEDAKQTYTTEVGKITDTGTLLSLYADPYGTKAKELFKDGKDAVPYRIQLKTVIKEKFEKDLGVTIVDIEAKNTKEIKIKATRGANDYRIYLDNASGTTLATMEEVTVDNNGKEQLKPVIQKQKVEGLNSGQNNMATVLFGPSSPASAPKAPATEPPAPGPEKPAMPGTAVPNAQPNAAPGTRPAPKPATKPAPAPKARVNPYIAVDPNKK